MTPTRALLVLLVALVAIGYRLYEDSNREQARLVVKGAKVQRALNKPASYDRDAVLAVVQLRSPQDQARFQSPEEETNLRDLLASAITRDIRPKINDNFPVDMYIGDSRRDRHVKTFQKATAVAGELAIQFPETIANDVATLQTKAREVKRIVTKTLSMGGFSTTRFPSARVRVYVVRRSLYTEYGEYAGEATEGWDPKRSPQTWLKNHNPEKSLAPPASPYLGTVVLFKKPARHQYLENRVWAESMWWAIQSPMSEMMQPRARYVRNVVVWREPEESRGDGELDLAFDGWVHEMWPSVEHAEDPFLFFHAHSYYELVVNLAVMMRSLFNFADVSDFRGRAVNEYLFA